MVYIVMKAHSKMNLYYSVIEQLGGKHLVMQLLTHEDPNVRYEALLCVQKLMVHNWEYLGRQLEKEKTGSESNSAVSTKA
ncbi:V-type proton ATPase subunit H-like [Limulus polyphemus]|uniref:V-type proton ATPase subunit H-like n=1 Tax=Limulus polyphemus TaxID=6850 RepID=A0ABM1TRI3_LIMPO|nr:V-type proton ATPase subunit H-like [Limulus polyphemus]